MNVLDGKLISKKIQENVKKEVESLETKPCLLVILVGNDQASQIYVSSKEKACKRVGMESKTIVLDDNISQKELINIIKQANEDKSIHGILVQMPLPKYMDELAVVDAIDPKKDVDGLHTHNQGKLMLGQNAIIPCTPKGIMRLLDEYHVQLQGKSALVIGRSILVGKPVAQLLLQRSATVTIAHSKTKNLKELSLASDIIVCAVGKPKTVTEDMVKDGAVIVDVGINRVLGTIVGDVDYLSVSPKTSRITPVPGGVGPMTIACLLENVLECYKLQVTE